MKKRLVQALLILLVLLVLSSIASAALYPYDVPWDVFGGGGGRGSTEDLVLDGTIGIPVGGRVGAGDYDLCSGFWCGLQAWVARSSLPVIFQNH